MAYTLEQLSADIRETLKADSGATGKQLVCKLVSKALLDQEFVARHLTAEQCRPRKVLYEDPELGFCVCGHVYENAAHGAPHDHGSSWAIYGLATGALSRKVRVTSRRWSSRLKLMSSSRAIVTSMMSVWSIRRSGRGSRSWC